MIHVAYSFDRRYRQHAAASIASLLLNFGDDGTRLHLHLITDSDDEEFQRRLDRFRRTFKARIDVLVLSPEQAGAVADLPTVNATIPYMSAATWLRLLLPDLLPDVDRLLYLDADTVVPGDIAELWNLDTRGALLAAVADASAKTMCERLGLPQYVNSGVMLMDLAQWRANGLVGAALECARREADRITYADQCVINLLLAGRIHLLPDRWNIFATVANRQRDFTGAGVIHYITRDKPWQAWYENPVGRLYWRYLDVSPWAGASPDEPTTTEQLVRHARLLAADGMSDPAAQAYERALRHLHRKRARSGA